MTSLDLQVGILSEKCAWSDRIMWLLQDEAGYPSELITKDAMDRYPVVVAQYERLIENPSIFNDYIREKGSLLVECSSHHKTEVKGHRTLEKILSVDFGDAQRLKGRYVVLEKGNPLLSFFPQHQLHPETRKDHILDIMIRKVRVFPPAKAIVEFEAVTGDRYPLLICGMTQEGGRFAIIASDDDTFMCQHSNLGPLLHLAALEWCLMNKPFVRKWHWSNGKRMAVILTFDFETLASYSADGKPSKYWWWQRSFDRLLLGLGLKPILKFLADKRVPSTWFVLGSQALHTPKFVKKLSSRELIEIAGHGDFHMDIDRSAKRFDEDDLSAQKERLEVMKQMIRSITPVPIEGFRAPGLYANHDTLVALQETGFLWDCSASPQTNYSTRWFFLPYNPIPEQEDKREIDILEIPIVEPWDQWCPIHGSPHSAQEYLDELLEDFRFLYFIGGLQTLLIHPYWIVAHKSSWKAVEFFISKIGQASDVAISTCGEVYSSWMSRKRMHFKAIYDSDKSTVHIQITNAEPGLSLMVHIPEEQRVLDVLLNDVASVPFKLWEGLHSIVFVLSTKGDCDCTIYLSKQ